MLSFSLLNKRETESVEVRRSDDVEQQKISDSALGVMRYRDWRREREREVQLERVSGV
jgi:hypothetical protein